MSLFPLYNGNRKIHFKKNSSTLCHRTYNHLFWHVKVTHSVNQNSTVQRKEYIFHVRTNGSTLDDNWRLVVCVMFFFPIFDCVGCNDCVQHIAMRRRCGRRKCFVVFSVCFCVFDDDDFRIRSIWLINGIEWTKTKNAQTKKQRKKT